MLHILDGDYGYSGGKQKIGTPLKQQRKRGKEFMSSALTPVELLIMGRLPKNGPIPNWNGGEKTLPTLFQEKNQYMLEIVGELNPEWIEWLMGWPIGWTDAKPLEMAKFHSWLQLHLRSLPNALAFYHKECKCLVLN
jgi:hypothetical protein